MKRSTINSRTSIRLSNPGTTPDQCLFASTSRLNGLHLVGKAPCVLLGSERLRNLRPNQLSAKTVIGIAHLKFTLQKLIDFGLNFSIHSQNSVRKAHTRIPGLISRWVKSANDYQVKVRKCLMQSA